MRPSKVTRAIAMVAPLVLAGHALAGRALAQGGEDAGAFILRRGADTISIENFQRTSATLTSELLTRTAGRVTFTATLTPAATVTRMTLAGYAPGATTPASQGVLTIGKDTATVDMGGGRVQRAPTTEGAIPWVNPSFALIDQIARRARVLNTWPARVPAFSVSGGATFIVTVDRIGADSLRITFPDAEMHVAVNAAGHVIGGRVPTQNIVVELVRGRRTLGFAPPDYSAPAGAPYVAETVKVPSPIGFTLGGTLTLPRARTGKVPAVVTITGSGLEDRDEAIPGVPGYRPFYQIADTLGRRGIAVLRLDDRSYGASGGDATRATSEDFAADIRAALAYLRTRPEIDPTRLFLLGHSEGGLIAPMIATAEPTLRGIVLMAGTALPGRKVIESQVRYAITRNPAISATGRDSALARQMMAVDSAGARIPWMHHFLAYDPLVAARGVRVPVLILQGANDRQVTADQAPMLADAFRSGGDRDVTLRIFPGLDHLFLADSTGNPAGYPTLPSKRIGGDVLGTIADWIAKHAG